MSLSVFILIELYFLMHNMLFFLLHIFIVIIIITFIVYFDILVFFFCTGLRWCSG